MKISRITLGYFLPLAIILGCSSIDSSHEKDSESADAVGANQAEDQSEEQSKRSNANSDSTPDSLGLLESTTVADKFEQVLSAIEDSVSLNRVLVERTFSLEVERHVHIELERSCAQQDNAVILHSNYDVNPESKANRIKVNENERSVVRTASGQRSTEVSSNSFAFKCVENFAIPEFSKGLIKEQQIEVQLKTESIHESSRNARVSSAQLGEKETQMHSLTSGSRSITMTHNRGADSDWLKIAIPGTEHDIKLQLGDREITSNAKTYTAEDSALTVEIVKETILKTQLPQVDEFPTFLSGSGLPSFDAVLDQPLLSPLYQPHHFVINGMVLAEFSNSTEKTRKVETEFKNVIVDPCNDIGGILTVKTYKEGETSPTHEFDIDFDSEISNTIEEMTRTAAKSVLAQAVPASALTALTNVCQR